MRRIKMIDWGENRFGTQQKTILWKASLLQGVRLSFFLHVSFVSIDNPCDTCDTWRFLLSLQTEKQ